MQEITSVRQDRNMIQAEGTEEGGGHRKICLHLFSGHWPDVEKMSSKLQEAISYSE